MNTALGRLYGTPGLSIAEASQKENLEKQASLELFVKLAADNNLDISTLADSEVAELWEGTFGTKLGGEMPPQFMAHAKGKGGDDKDEKKDEPGEKKEEKKDDKEKKAAAELAQAQEGEMKIAMADHMGRTMAHAFVNELEQINVARVKEAAAKTAAPVATETPAVPAAAALAPTKIASAIDQLAFDKAVKLAEAEGIATEVVTRKLAARNELGFAPSTKVASVGQGNLQAAVDVRALELLEQAGFPIAWT